VDSEAPLPLRRESESERERERERERRCAVVTLHRNAPARLNSQLRLIRSAFPSN